ncbi:MAG: DedA family protein [Planctomycetota bacterium]
MILSATGRLRPVRTQLSFARVLLCGVLAALTMGTGARLQGADAPAPRPPAQPATPATPATSATSATSAAPTSPAATATPAAPGVAAGGTGGTAGQAGSGDAQGERHGSATHEAAVQKSVQKLESTWYYYYLSHYGYLAFFLVLLAISLGIPLPEEIFLLTAGYLAHLTAHGDPEIGIDVRIITVVCFFGILAGDLFVYSLGRFKGEKVRQWKWFKRLMPDAAFVRVRAWFDRSGVWATAAFRFMPPIRMPGFFAAGLLRQSPLKFVLTDGIACMISIPTQIYLVYYFGGYIIPYVKRFNVVLLIVLGVAIVGYVIWELLREKKAAAVTPGGLDAKAPAGTAAPGTSGEADLGAPNTSTTGIAALDGAEVEHIHTNRAKIKTSKALEEADPR